MSERIGRNFFHGPFALARRIHEEEGAAVIPFILALPLFLMIVAIVVQYVMLSTAYTVVSTAAEAAARSAMVSLPEENTDAIKRAAYMVLANLSPKATSADPEGQSIADAYEKVGMTPGPFFAERYSYAMQAAEVSWDPRDYSKIAGTTSWVEIKYQFQLTVPGAWSVLAPTTSTVGGVTGHFATVTRRVQLFTTPSRKTQASDMTGPPLQP